MAEEKALIPFKSVNLSQIQKRVDRALARMRTHYDTEPRGEHFEAFVQALFSVFPATIRYDVFFASIMDLVGKRMTRDLIRETAWRLAGNINRLKQGKPAPPFLQQTELEWCLVTLVRGNIGHGYDGKLGFFYDYRIMSGQATGKRFTLFWSLKYARFVSRSLGFRRTRQGYLRMTDGADLVRMRLYLLFDPKLSREDRPGSYHFYVSSACKKYNQKILKQRFRIIPCPLRYTLSEQACHNCPQGYDQCNAGCHPATYVTKACPRCDNTEAWFDPLGRNVICVECEDQERRQHD